MLPRLVSRFPATEGGCMTPRNIMLSDYHLTPHELRLLKLLVEGHNYKTAAKEVGTTVHAVSFHMKNIYEKLEVHSKSEAVAKALRDHIVT